MIFALIIAFSSLIALMIIHEFGHFIIAKKFGVKVEEFGIGYPPRLFGKQFGDTIYSVNLVPLGAFVKIYGEESLDASEAGSAGSPVLEIDDYRSFSGLAIWKRILIVLGGVIAFWIASVIIFSFVSITGASVPIGDQDVTGFSKTSVRVVVIQENSPAQVAGLKTHDTIRSVKVDGQEMRVNKVVDFQELANQYKGKLVTLVIDRAGSNLELSLTPRAEYPEGQGPVGIGLERFANVIEKAPFWQAPWHGLVSTVKITWQILGGIVTFISNMIAGQGVPLGAALAGPVGITIFLARAADFGPGFFLYFIGSISVLLAIFNLLPIPALDGGKLLFLIIEKVKGSPVSTRIEQNLTVIFFIILISLSLFITVKFDIPRVIEFWKAGF